MRALFTIIIIAASASFAARGVLTPPANTGSSYFIANEGQWEGDFQFKCEVGSTIYYITPQGMTVDFRSGLPQNSSANLGGLRGVSVILNEVKDPSDTPVSVRGHVIQIHYASASPEHGSPDPAGIPSGTNKLPHYSNYFLSRDSTKWRSRVGHFENVIVPEVWPGIDVEYRADKQGVETIYHVQPGADLAQIQMEYLGLDQPLQIDANGNLILSTSLGDLKEQAPYSYHQQGRVQQKITSSVRLLGNDRIGFNLGEYDRAKELVIDPLIYSTFWGNGWGDWIAGIDVDSEGNKVVTGGTSSEAFPVTPGAYRLEPVGFFSGFISKFNRDMDSLLFSTYFVFNYYAVIMVARDNTIWWVEEVYGDTTFLLTPNAIDTVSDGHDIGIAQFSADGTQLLFSTYWGGTGSDYNGNIVDDSDGMIHLVGATRSPDLQTTINALSTTLPAGENGFILVLDPATHAIRFSSYLPTSALSPHTVARVVRPIEAGRIWLAGFSSEGLPTTLDAFQPDYEATGEGLLASYICLIDLNIPEIVYCSYWGNMEGEWGDYIYDLVPLASDRILLCGQTETPDYQLPEGGFQQFPPLGRVNPFVIEFRLPNQILHGTFLGGDNGLSYVYHCQLLQDSTAVLFGDTYADDFPVTPDALDSTQGGGHDNPIDCFVVRMSADLSSMLYGTYVGGWEHDNANGMALDNGIIWIGGSTEAFDFPTTPDAFYPNFSGASERGFISGFEFIPVNPCDSIRVPELVATIEGFDVQLDWQPAEIPEGCLITPPLTYDIHFSTNGVSFTNIGYSTATAFTDLDALHRYARGFYHVTLRNE